MYILKSIICILLSLLDFNGMINGGAVKFMDKADVTFYVNKSAQVQEFDGFGASACWWSQDIGNSPYEEEVAKGLYSKDGLALNIYRYNVGAGEKENPNSRISGNRATESFYYFNEETNQYEYDFTRDANAQRMLDLCLSYGCIDTVVLFANSPHYSMTVSGQATGGLEEYQSNLPRENYEAFADYFLTITEYFVNKGVPVKFISPINEPQWSWGGPHVRQEGCHYEIDEAVELYRVFARKLAESDLDVLLMAPESGEIGWRTNEYFDKLMKDEEISPYIGSLAYHSYWSDVNLQGKIDHGNMIRNNYSDIRVDMSEWCELPCQHSIDDFMGAVIMARVMAQDIADSKVNSWQAWVGVNNYSKNEEGKLFSDGLYVANNEATELYKAMRYYAVAHFSKYIPAGSVMLDVKTDVKDFKIVGNDTLKSLSHCTFLTPEGKTVMVIVNEGKTRNGIFTVAGTKMTVIQSDSENQLETEHKGLFKPVVKLPANSITTIIWE